jgi:hypothetical protein
MRVIILHSLLALTGCGSCIDPFTKLSDCPSGAPGRRSDRK